MVLIHEKKITTLCIGNRHTATTLVKICPKKPMSQERYLERSKWAVLWNLSLIYIMIMICEKKIPLYVLDFALQLQHWSKFAPKISIKVLRKVQMSCALELKPHSNIDDDLWKKFWCLDTQNPCAAFIP